jgi:3-dehydroquinate dehydratase
MDRLRQLLRGSPRQRVATVGMGKLGAISRFWLPYQGSVLTYGFLDRAAASGQVPVEELAKFFKLKN